MSPRTWAWKRNPKDNPIAGFGATAGPRGEVQDERRCRASWDQVNALQAEHSGTQGKAHTVRITTGSLAKASCSVTQPRRDTDSSFLQERRQSGISEAPGMCKGAYVLLQGRGGGNKYNRTFSAMKTCMLTY